METCYIPNNYGLTTDLFGGGGAGGGGGGGSTPGATVALGDSSPTVPLEALSPVDATGVSALHSGYSSGQTVSTINIIEVVSHFLGYID